MKTFFKIIFLFFILVQNIFSSQINLAEEEIKWLKNNPNIILGGMDNYPPTFFTNEKGEVDGKQQEYLSLINKKLGTNFRIKLYPTFKEMIGLAKSGEIHGSSVIFVDGTRKKDFILTKPLFYTHYYIYTRNEDAFEYPNMDSLEGLRVAFHSKNSLSLSLIKKYPKIIPIMMNTPIEMIEALLSKEVDVIIHDISIEFWKKKKQISSLESGIIVNETKRAVGMAINKKYPLLVDILNKGIVDISNDDNRDIYNHWFGAKNKSINLTQEEKKYLENNSKFIIQGLATFPPFNFFQNGKASGYSIDYMKLLGEYLGIDIEFTKPKSFGDTISMFKNAEIDILPHIARNKKREEYIDYTDFNHIEYSIGVTIRKDENISNIKDLENKTVAVVNKTFIESFFKKNYPNQKLLSLPSTSDAVEAVSLGKADALIGSIPTMNFYIQKNWLNNVMTTKIDINGLPNRVSMPMGVQKGNTTLKSILEKVNLAVPHNEIIKLKEKWLNINIKDKSNLLLTEEEKNYLSRKKKIKMCVLPNWLPFEQIDEKGNHKGVGADIVNIISKELEVPFELVYTKEWSQSLQNIRNRKCDVLPVAMDIPSRRDAMNFTKAYDKEPFVIATKNDALFIKDSKDIGDRKVGIVKSYAFIEVLKQRNPGIEIISVKNAKDGLEKVRSGELFGYIDIVPAIIYTMQQNSLVDLKISGKLEFDIKLSMASRNDEPLLNIILQKSLNTISEEKIRSIVGKWLSVKVEQRVDYTLLWQVSLFFILIILIVLYKNREVQILNGKLIDASKEIEEQQQMVNKHVMILTTDLKGTITYVNEAYCKKIGYEIDELIGSDHNIIRHPDMSTEFFKEMWEDIDSNKNWSGEIRNLTKNKDSVYFSVVVEPLIKNGKKVGYRSISEDITDKKRIEELSITDKLTGLYNRLKIDEFLEKQVNLFTRYKTPFSIILLDIDNFKNINDNYGHDMGDYVLMELAKILKESIRKTDETGRWGGEEFIIICSNIDLNGAYIVAEHVRKAIEKNGFNKVGKITASLGVSTFSDSDNLDSIFKRVDNALYEAKRNGKNQTVV